jgi:uncharacterized protein YkwD
MGWLRRLRDWLARRFGPDPEPAPDGALGLLGAVNAARRSRGLGPVATSEPLGAVAEVQAAYCARVGGLTHDGPLGGIGARAIRFGYAGPAEECLARGRPAAGAVAGWLDDPPHRAIVLDPAARDFGGALVMAGADGATPYWCLVLGRGAS